MCGDIRRFFKVFCSLLWIFSVNEMCKNNMVFTKSNHAFTPKYLELKNKLASKFTLRQENSGISYFTFKCPFKIWNSLRGYLHRKCMQANIFI